MLRTIFIFECSESIVVSMYNVNITEKYLFVVKTIIVSMNFKYDVGLKKA